MRTKYIYIFVLLVSFGLFSCEMRDELRGTSVDGPTGKVALHLLLQQEEAAKSSDSSPNIDDFYICILDMNGNPVREIKSYSLISDGNGSIELPAGDYVVYSASYSGEIREISLDKPFYAGETIFSVKANQQTVVENICKQGSTKIELDLGNDFLDAVMPNYAITLTNNQGVLTLNKDHYGVVYLKPSAALNVVVRATTKEGKDVYKSFNITNEEGMLKPSDELKITFGAEEAKPPVKPDPEDPDPNPDPGPEEPEEPEEPEPEPGESYGSIKITIDVTLNGRDEDIIITYPDDPDPGETPAPSPGEKPVINGTGTKTYAKGSAAGAVKVSINTSSGIQNLYVTIDSPFLTPEELGGLGIPTTFDLANLSSDLSEAFKELGLIGSSPIKGAKSTSFDIGPFVSLLDVNTHKFHISVTDADAEKADGTLTIIITE